MKKLFMYSTLVVGLTLGSAASAYAWPKPWPHDPGPAYAAPAPEVDPAMAVSGITLVAGMLTVMRARKKK